MNETLKRVEQKHIVDGQNQQDGIADPARRPAPGPATERSDDTLPTSSEEGAPGIEPDPAPREPARASIPGKAP